MLAWPFQELAKSKFCHCEISVSLSSTGSGNIVASGASPEFAEVFPYEKNILIEILLVSVEYFC